MNLQSLIKLQSLIETEDDITFAFNDLPVLKVVRSEGVTGDYDSVTEKI